MTENGNVMYRYQTVKVIRGREANKVAEMQRQGWEVDRQDTGRLRTEITFRQVVAPTRFKPWMGAASLIGVGVLLLGGVAIAEAVGGGDDSEKASDEPAVVATTQSSEPTDSANTESEPASSSETVSESPSETASEAPPVTPSENMSESPPETASATPTEAPSMTAPPIDEVLTVKNSPALKELLAKGESGAICKAFAKTYAGRKVEFDGSVSTVGGGTYLVYAGDDSDTKYVPGPSFQFKTLSVGGAAPRAGDNLHFIATVGTYNSIQGVFALTQVTTTRR